MKEKLSVVYSCDENYAKIMAVSMISLFETNKIIEELTVYCLLYRVENITKEHLIRLGKKYNRKVVCIDSKFFCDKYRFWEKGEDSRYVRLITDKILNHERIVLYLDCDIIITAELQSIIDLDMKNSAVAAVLDTCRIDARKESHIKNVDLYFNSGVLVMNLEYWREKNLYNTFKIFKEIHNNHGIYRDQRVLNGTVGNNVYILPLKYNVTPEIYQYSCNQIKKLCGISQFYSQNELETARRNPAIVHFAGRTIDRPWYDNCEHIFRDSYRKYMKKDEFTDFEIYREKISKKIKWKIKKHLPFFIVYMVNKYFHKNT